MVNNSPFINVILIPYGPAIPHVYLNSTQRISALVIKSNTHSFNETPT